MTDKFRNKYRISSSRAPWWDYSHNGASFVTIVTQDRECYFGEILNIIHNPSDWENGRFKI